MLREFRVVYFPLFVDANVDFFDEVEESVFSLDFVEGAFSDV